MVAGKCTHDAPVWTRIAASENSGWRLLAQADVAQAALAAASANNEAFYQGKIATAQFFAKNMLPNLTALRGIIDAIDDGIMGLPEAAF